MAGEENQNEPKANWSYNADDTEVTTEDHGLPSAVEDVSWTASEYIAHDKAPGWYAVVLGATVAFALVVFLLDSNKGWFSPLLIVVAGIIFMVAAKRKPKVLQYSIDNAGLHIGSKTYNYGQFKSFSLVQEGPITSIVFTPLQRFMPSLTIYFEPKDQDKITDALSAYLPHETKKLDPVDNLMRKIRF